MCSRLWTRPRHICSRFVLVCAMPSFVPCPCPPSDTRQPCCGPSNKLVRLPSVHCELCPQLHLCALKSLCHCAQAQAAAAPYLEQASSTAAQASDFATGTLRNLTQAWLPGG